VQKRNRGVKGEDKKKKRRKKTFPKSSDVTEVLEKREQ